MGAASGNEACMMSVLNLALQYNTLDIVENGYGISLRDMIAFAQETYRDCTWFMPVSYTHLWCGAYRRREEKADGVRHQE